ncbi:MAG TPA: hypothetical protein VIO64_21245 [Pseudobacteroides sp.]|uniref:hypothetical protein n=1 Tax=Pseudobacteroides sp. TaxID=1968840 RepID=UPI002F9596AE
MFKVRFKAYSKQFKRFFGEKLIFEQWDDFYFAVFGKFKERISTKEDFIKEKTKLKDIIFSNSFMEKLLSNSMFFVGGILASRLIDFSKSTSNGVSENLIFTFSLLSIFVLMMVIINAIIPDKDKNNFYNTCLNILEENKDEFY